MGGKGFWAGFFFLGIFPAVQAPALARESVGPAVLFEVKSPNDSTLSGPLDPLRHCNPFPALGSVLCFRLAPPAAALVEEGMAVRKLVNPFGAALLGAMVFRAYFNPADLENLLPLPPKVREFERTRITFENVFLAYLAVKFLPLDLAQRIAPGLLKARDGEEGEAGRLPSQAAAASGEGGEPPEMDPKPPKQPRRSYRELTKEIQERLNAMRVKLTNRWDAAPLTRAERLQLRKYSDIITRYQYRSVRDSEGALRALKSIERMESDVAALLKALGTGPTP
jgi:hypothetical protein